MQLVLASSSRTDNALHSCCVHRRTSMLAGRDAALRFCRRAESRAAQRLPPCMAGRDTVVTRGLFTGPLEEEGSEEFDELRSSVPGPWDQAEDPAKWMEEMHEIFDIEDLVQIAGGINGLPTVQMAHPNGQTLEIYLHGATVTSWQDRAGNELLYLQPGCSFDGRGPIEGGVQLCFPQYGPGRLPDTGFSSACSWQLINTGVGPDWVEDPCPWVRFRLQPTDSTRSVWDHDFEINYTIALMETDDFSDPGEEELERTRGPLGEFLQEMDQPVAAEEESVAEEDVVDGAVNLDDEVPLQLGFLIDVVNKGSVPMEFQIGLPMALAVEDMRGNGFVRAQGLQGCYYMDRGLDRRRPLLRREAEQHLSFQPQGTLPLDRLYCNVHKQPQDLLLCPGDRTHFELQLRQGFQDVVAQNPGALLGEASHHFVVFSGARAALPIRLEPGDVWNAELVLRRFEQPWGVGAYNGKEPGVPLPRPVLRGGMLDTVP